MRKHKVDFSIWHVLRICAPILKLQMLLRGPVDTGMGAVIHIQGSCDPTQDCRTSFWTSWHQHSARKSASQSLHVPIWAQGLPGNCKEFSNRTGLYWLCTNYCTGQYIHAVVEFKGDQGRPKSGMPMAGKGTGSSSGYGHSMSLRAPLDCVASVRVCTIRHVNRL